ncbi:agmatinase [Endozoicomonas sp. OPT23]|uniref:agmatinase n=1 Tax=Endozoicomonas sp. OPT23 TaxID=2072845 RepID=UPI00129B3AB7|nr:agmatinase [Endozoicomonas sp. OPT23]MRI35273.1 agmatinase [Endozoicomonas sp. OPT23]
MSENTYEKGRLNLPFVGFCTFAKSRTCEDWDNIKADVAFMGAPFDCGTQWRSGARMGPRSVREASTLFSFGHGGAYSYEEDTMYLEGVNIVDIGDADMVHTNTEKSHANIEYGVRKMLEAGALPVTVGGDHSVNAPCIRAFEQYANKGPIHIIQIDAHLDFVDERHGVRYGHGNPMRRASEQSYISGMTQLGIRNVSSSNRSDHKLAEEAGSTILSVRDVRRLGVEGVMELIPKDVNYYITIDIDGFDPSIAPGTGTPSHGGFQYYEVMEVLQQVAHQGEVVGIDLCEVAPDYDQSNTTSILAAQVLLNLLGYVFHARAEKARQSS